MRGRHQGPGLILFVRTPGDPVKFNLHIHLFAAHRVIGADSTTWRSPGIPARMLEFGVRCTVFNSLCRKLKNRMVRKGILTPEKSG
jgi:hypothetical protein